MYTGTVRGLVVAFAGFTVLVSCATRDLRPGQACGHPLAQPGSCPTGLVCTRQSGGPCEQEGMPVCTKICETDADCNGYETRWGGHPWICKPRCAGATAKICDWASAQPL